LTKLIQEKFYKLQSSLNIYNLPNIEARAQKMSLLASDFMTKSVILLRDLICSLK